MRQNKEHKFDADILDMDIKIKNLKERVEGATYEYHNNLLEVLDAKTNGDGLGGATIEKKFRKCIEQFSSVVALQRSSIEYSMELAKKQLERAFDLSGIDLNKVFAENKDENSRK